MVLEKKEEAKSRGLMGYPIDSPIDIARIEALELLLRWSEGPIRVRLPLAELVVDFDSRLPAQLLYYMCCGDYEQSDIEIANEYVVPGDVVMEIGGGIGITGCALAKASKRKTIVVEANPLLWEHIKRNFSINNAEVELIEAAAVGDEHTDNTVSFNVSPNYWWSSLAEATGSTAYEAAAIKLSTLIDDYKPSVLVIDIEGAEEFVVPNSINNCVKRIFIEIHTPSLGGRKSGIVVRKLERMGFRMLDIRSYTWIFERE